MSVTPVTVSDAVRSESGPSFSPLYRQSKGTFVASHAEQQQQYRFLRLMPDEGREAGLGRQLLDCRRQRAPAWIARQFGMRAGDAMVEERRILHSGGQPVVLDDIWLPGDLFKGLTT